MFGTIAECVNCTITDYVAADTLRIQDIIEIFIYFVSFSLGGPLNLMALLKSLRLQKKQRAKNQILLLKLNLNVADLLTMFVYVPTQIIWMLAFQWYGGDLLCRVCKFFSTFSFYANSFVVACIAIDRVFGAYNISSISASRASYERCRKKLIVAWVLAFVFSVPQAFIFGLVTFQPKYKDENFFTFQQCTPIWDLMQHELFGIFNDPNTTEAEAVAAEELAEKYAHYSHLYNVFHLLFVFWIPVVVIILSYACVLLLLHVHSRGSRGSEQLTFTAILDTLIHRKKTSGETEGFHFYISMSMIQALRPSSTSKIGPMAKQTIERARHVAKRQAALIIIAYMTFWTPYNLLAIFNALQVQATVSGSFLSVLNTLIVANPIANPLIYGVFEKQPRRGAQK